uniref:Uncharacterized protein n=1 Tax=Plectus sambesii TaxID=2011161 RepID=A0A914WMI8_9BILA
MVKQITALILLLILLPVLAKPRNPKYSIKPIMWQRGTGLASFLSSPYQKPIQRERSMELEQVKRYTNQWADDMQDMIGDLDLLQKPRFG